MSFLNTVTRRSALFLLSILALCATATAQNAQRASIRSFTLVNADTGEEIQLLNDGDRILLSKLPSKNITIRADTEPERVTRVVFRLDQFRRYREETSLPYALAGDLHGRYLPWKAKAGQHTMEAFPYLGDAQGISKKVSFSVLTKEEEAKEIAEAPAEDLHETLGASETSPTSTETPEPTVEPTPETTPTEIPTPTETPTPTPTPEPEEEPVIEVFLPPTPTPSPIPTATPAPTKAPTSIPTAQPTPITTPTLSALEKMAFELSPARVVPPSNSTAFGRCLASFDKTTGELTLGCTHTIIGPNSAAVLKGRTGDEGASVCSLGLGDSPIAATCLLSPTNAALLNAGELYVELRSIAYPGGDLRGQIRDEALKSKQ